MPYGWEGEIGHYDGGDNEMDYGRGSNKDKGWGKWGRVADYKWSPYCVVLVSAA
uniref:Uncharacterized protein n=1 Tax=Romanomermis culicivorax TaxID=13658 RepID=A0A915HGW6_ROMCU